MKQCLGSIPSIAFSGNEKPSESTISYHVNVWSRRIHRRRESRHSTNVGSENCTCRAFLERWLRRAKCVLGIILSNFSAEIPYTTIDWALNEANRIFGDSWSSSVTNCTKDFVRRRAHFLHLSSRRLMASFHAVSPL